MDKFNQHSSEDANFAQTYSLKQGLKKFGEKGTRAAFDEMKQLHIRGVFEPVQFDNLSEIERERAMESLIFLVEKGDDKIKARTCANGSVQRTYISKEEAASPTVATESIFLTSVVDAKEHRDVMTIDIPNAFVQTSTTNDDDNERIIMKIRGPLVDMLIELDPMRYQSFVRTEKDQSIVYVEVKKAIYGMLKSAILFYKKLKSDLEQIGFKINPYDPCVANRMIKGSQHTVIWHVDDLKSSHESSEVNDQFWEWLNNKYGNTNISTVKKLRGKVHKYLGMTLDYTENEVVKISMQDYIESLIREFPYELKKDSKYPWNKDLFKITDSKELPKQQKEIFHTFVAKCLFMAKRARPDIMPCISFLTTRVKSPTSEDLEKLITLLQFLKRTKHDNLKLSMKGTCIIKWYVDASFAVHPDMRSHTGAVMTLGDGAIQVTSTKQKINTRSSTEAELIAFDDVISKILWTKLFLKEQGFDIEKNVVYRDNTAAMKLEVNGKQSSGKRTRHFEIKYFFMNDLINRKELEVEYCPTDRMIGDYMTKPLLGTKFEEFRNQIMNLK